MACLFRDGGPAPLTELTIALSEYAVNMRFTQVPTSRPLDQPGASMTWRGEGGRERMGQNIGLYRSRSQPARGISDLQGLQIGK